ncbi:MAG: 16S rRNA (adenine(1518)-N(6)/adenine(1519)-N(6))-dimethyltransferase RsmA [Firmicutes bacterium]|nr:16S rRNA (adenine(1518)-N(6)/adenine(1519)-N(6))-dimethyltransferase RsmA [Bacillota bacterium]
MNLYERSTIEAIRQEHNFRLSKSLGQNFIADYGVIEDIVSGSETGEDDLVIEIGPGIGVLTDAAAEAAAKVVAIEIDDKLIPILEQTLAHRDNVRIIHEDVLKVDINRVIEEERAAGSFSGKVRIMGNLPYYITTPIVMGLLEKGVRADTITVMMQKEVADRIKAEPGSKAYGALSVAVQYYCSVELVTDVSRNVFVPRPKVDSAVLKLTLRDEKPVELIDESVFFSCVKAGFGQRRKTLLNSLTGLSGFGKDEIREILDEADIDPARRAETLTIEEFAKVANAAADRRL